MANLKIINSSRAIQHDKTTTEVIKNDPEELNFKIKQVNTQLHRKVNNRFKLKLRVCDRREINPNNVNNRNAKKDNIKCCTFKNHPHPSLKLFRIV